MADATPRVRLTSKLQTHRRMLRRGDISGVVADYRRWLWHTEIASGYRGRLTDLPPEPPARVDFDFGPLAPDEASMAFDPTGMNVADARELDARLRLWESGLGTCYAARVDGFPAYLGWIMHGRTERQAVLDFFDKVFLPVADDELLLEGSWVHPDHRGVSLAAAAMHRAISTGLDHGIEYAVTFVGDDNPASWIGVTKMGLRRFVSRRGTWRLMRSRVVWTPTDEQLEPPPRPTASETPTSG